MTSGSGVLALHLVAMAQASFARPPHGYAGQLSNTDPRSDTSHATLGTFVVSVTGRAFDCEERTIVQSMVARDRADAEIAGLEQCMGEDTRPFPEPPVAPQAAITRHLPALVELAGLSAHAASDALMLLLFEYLLGPGRDLPAPLRCQLERAT